jgi:lipopolysaccharide export system protein LptA
MLKRCFRNSLLMIVSLVLPLATQANEQEKERREPIVITSGRMEADKLGDKITFTGDVVLKKEGMTLYSDSMIVFYDVPTKAMKEIEALGNVVVRKEGRVALSNRAIYDNAEEKIVLTGDARIIENENQMGGDRITLFLREDRSIVEGGKVMFYQDRDTHPESGKRK